MAAGDEASTGAGRVAPQVGRCPAARSPTINLWGGDELSGHAESNLVGT